jgi:hypothetical protein
MKDISDKEKFIELRAQGLSFAKISAQIGVSKPILIKWNNEFRKEIANQRFLIAEELIEKYELMKVSRINIFAELLNKAIEELKKRDFETSSIKELIKLVTFLDSNLKNEAESITCITDSLNWIHSEDLESIKIPLID